MIIKIKVCGITNLEDALTCVEAGADALGFIFVEGTPRFVTPDQAVTIIRALPPFVTPVGVFWDHPSGHVKAVAEACGLRALQFHGDERPDELADYPLPVIKTIKVATALHDIEPAARRFRGVAAALLLDSGARWSEGEAREPVEWAAAARLVAAQRGNGGAPVILSAGLTPDNVARAIEVVRPYAVDVNSGVEVRPGRKDPDKVRRFVAGARGAA